MELLKTISLDEAISKTKEVLNKIQNKIIEIDINNANNYILAQDIYALADIPGFKRSTVDGYAINYQDILGASEVMPVFLKCIGQTKMGEACDLILKEDECVLVQTGSMIPQNANAVVMVEYSDHQNDEVAIYKRAKNLENIVSIGEECKRDKLLFKKGHKLKPLDIGILSVFGYQTILVYDKLHISIISTGDELKSTGDKIKLGEIYDVNTNMLRALCLENDLIVDKTYILKDDYDLIKKTILEAKKLSDIIVVSGGSSKGEKDYTANIFNDIGDGLLFHGIRVKPGKPSILAYDHLDNCMLCGLPGHPIAAYLIFNLLILNNLGYKYQKVIKKCHENIFNSDGRTNIILIKIVDDKIVPIYTKSGLITKMLEADGFVIIDENKEGLLKDEEVEVYLL